MMTWALSVGACSDAAEEEPIDCSASDRVGLYLFQWGVWDNESCVGTPLPPGWVDYQWPMPDSCTFDAPDQWEDEECTLVRSYTCTDTEQDLVTAWSGATTQLDDDAERLSGNVTVHATRLDGTAICALTREIELFRN
jgi:hypothetical protein